MPTPYSGRKAGSETTLYTWPRFSKISIPHAFGEIEDELNHLNATDVVITSNSKTGRFGNVLDNQTNVKDVGVAVYFTWD